MIIDSEKLERELIDADLLDDGISWSSDGSFTLSEEIPEERANLIRQIFENHVPRTELEKAKQAAKKELDLVFENATNTYLDGSLAKLAEYIVSLIQNTEYRKNGKAPPPPNHVSSYSRANGITDSEASDLLNTIETQWLDAQTNMKEFRIAGRNGLNSATTRAEIRQVLRSAKSSINGQRKRE
jgi:hypothetical protein